MFGQMIALLELPPHIAPLLFCWPAGVVSLQLEEPTILLSLSGFNGSQTPAPALTPSPHQQQQVTFYHPARYLGAEDPRCHAALVAVLRQLATQGVERVHIACHSMVSDPVKAVYFACSAALWLIDAMHNSTCSKQQAELMSKQLRTPQYPRPSISPPLPLPTPPSLNYRVRVSFWAPSHC